LPGEISAEDELFTKASRGGHSDSMRQARIRFGGVKLAVLSLTLSRRR
jgi:hypothetical protein